MSCAQRTNWIYDTMKHAPQNMRRRIGPFFTALVCFGLGTVPGVFAQEAADTASAQTGFGTEGNFLLWDLIGEAGGFQYPIFGLLAIGLFLISAKLYELYKDRKAARELEEASLEEMEMKRIAMLVANQKESMLAELQATMINVYQTTKDAATLHEEIANYIQFQRDRFGTFKLRIDFLADTAGAVGLLGTVWGILTVFTGGGIDDEQRVLAGMGVALISTLLGLVVSITLNLISTEVHSFFDNRLDQIEDKADELRFRLLELGLEETNGRREAVSDRAEAASPTPSAGSEHQNSDAASEQDPDSVLGDGTGEATETGTIGASDSPTAVETRPRRLEVVDRPDEGTVASTLSDNQLRVTAENGDPIADEEVMIEAGAADGQLNGGTAELTRRTDEQGVVSFDWHLPESPGTCEVHARVPAADGPDATCTLSVPVRPGGPRHYRQDGNNQGAEVGGKVPNPLTVKLIDEYQNPVPDQRVRYEVDAGGGTFENGETSTEVVTDENGVASVTLFVGDEPGINTVKSYVGDEVIEFQAMALEQ